MTTNDLMSKPSLSQERHEDQNVHNYDGFTNTVASEIQNLARIMSNASIQHSKLHRHHSHQSTLRNSEGEEEYPNEKFVDERLNPNSSEFSSTYWIQNAHTLVMSDVDYFKPVHLGVAFKNLRAYGQASDADYQSTFINCLPKFVASFVRENILGHSGPTFDILKPMDGLIKPGELTVVLGRPGAGCSTFLKTIATQTHGYKIDKDSIIRYNSLSADDIRKHFRGEVVYCSETEHHFPQLSVGDTLEFAARMRTPQNRPLGVTREEYAKHLAAVVMAVYGLSHTRNTKVGDDFVRGVSGGERKRVSIAEITLNNARIQCWDNSTRGLDSATALEFLKALKAGAEIIRTTPLVAIYQCSQDAYDLFDKVVLMYEGYQIYFGSSQTAKQYFLDMGYDCPPRQTTADFLTSLTNPAERIVKPGFENKVPRTPEEFYNYWRKSNESQQLIKEVDEYLEEHDENEQKSLFKAAHSARQSNHLKVASPYTVSFFMQVRYIAYRNYLRIKGNPSIHLFQILGNIGMSFVLSSIFYNLPSTTSSFYHRTASLFFGVLFNAFSSLLEIFSLYEARPIIEKHKKYALYHPAADACASVMTEIPTKVIIAIGFNLVYYFMINFRRDAGSFFYYLLINFMATLVMSHIFRTIGAATKTIQQAMTPAALLLLALTIYTGFVVPVPYMLGWSRWINYLNPLAYAFESLVANEFHDRDFACSQFIPSGGSYPTAGINRICNTVGSIAGELYVSGTTYIDLSFQYRNSHRWRNFGILVGFVIFFFATYLILCELNKGAMQKGEILLFQKKALKKLRKMKKDIESGAIEKTNVEFENIQIDTTTPSNEDGDIFFWRNLTYQVKIKSEDRVILDHIDGWVKPGQVTALMGASGAGKTTLLNALSDRLTSGTVTDGVRLVNGRPLDSSFQRSIGYVQQQDLHLETSTVREALKFAAYLRQPKSVSKKEKDEYVEYIIQLLEMEKYSDAVVGVTGEGLNVEQRKRLSIGVELVAKPKLLVFLDEPTSGLDSQTAWSICKLIRKLADNGQAILCTIHQPSAVLLAEFDRLLFLQRGGQTVYFGDLGKNFSTLIDYFEKYGAPKCPPEANPAEWMLEVIGAAPGSKADQNYYDVWLNSTEYKDMQNELDCMETELQKRPISDDPDRYKSYAASLLAQYFHVTIRLFEQNWRSPNYLYSKLLLVISSSLFNGFSFFQADRSMQGLMNQLYSVFMYMVIVHGLSQGYIPTFVSQRNMYEARERESKTFSWFTFVAAQVTAEVPWNILCGTIGFFCWYYPIGFQNNAAETGTVAERGALMWFAIVLFFIYASTLAQLCISFLEIGDNAVNLVVILLTMCLSFCGVMVTKEDLPGFWIFMYRCNPFTYLISVILSVGLANTTVTCAENEYLRIIPPQGYTCQQYMQPFMEVVGGYLLDGTSNVECQYCTVNTTNVFLHQANAEYANRGRDTGIFIAFIAINIIGTFCLYYLARVPKNFKFLSKRKN
ncbi:CDR4 ABC transporter CDR4 [Candida maltosa Xu316]